MYVDILNIEDIFFSIQNIFSEDISFLMYRILLNNKIKKIKLTISANRD